MQKLHKAPKIHAVTLLNLPEVNHYSTTSSVPVYEIEKPACNVIKMELVFLAGRPFEHKPLASTCSAYQLREGTKRFSSKEIAEKIDFYGATLSVEASLDTINVQIVSLKKHFNKVVEILQSIITEPLFPQKELKNFIKRRIESLKVDLAKNDVVSYRLLTEILYGSEHPYGYNSSEDLYLKVDREDLISHFKEYIVAHNCTVFIAGDIESDHRKAVKDLLNALPAGKKAAVPSMNNLISSTENVGQLVSTTGGVNQASIKMGKKIFGRQHPDYPYLNFVTTLLGGYFGSRLVSNIREAKGLTYGIYAMLDTQLYDGCMIISTDVANKNVELCIKEIHKEIKKLCEVPVSSEELNLVKNYFAGTYLNFFDGPFNSLRAIKSLVLNQIPLSDLKSILDISQSITSDQVLDISHKYLNGNDFWEVVVGAPRT